MVERGREAMTNIEPGKGVPVIIMVTLGGRANLC